MGSKIKDKLTDDGVRFQKLLKELAEKEVRVGFQKGLTYPDGTEVLDVAMWNELGTEKIPSRPFLRNSVDENKDKITAFLHSKVKNISQKASVESVLKDIGVFQKSLIQEKIRKGNFQPNAAITIHGGWIHNKKTGKSFYVKGKKSKHPLIDTALMRQSVNYVIKKKGSDK